MRKAILPAAAAARTSSAVAREDGVARVLRDERSIASNSRDRVRVRLLSRDRAAAAPRRTGTRRRGPPSRIRGMSVCASGNGRGEVRVLVHEALRHVVVRVDDDRCAVQVLRREDGRPRVRRRSGHRRGGAGVKAAAAAGATGAGSGPFVGVHAVTSAIAVIQPRRFTFAMKAGVPRRRHDCKKALSGQTMFVVPPHGVTTTTGHVPLSLVTHVYVLIGAMMAPGACPRENLARAADLVLGAARRPQHVCIVPHAAAEARRQMPLPESVPPASDPPLSPPESLPLSAAAPEELESMVASAAAPESSEDPPVPPPRCRRRCCCRRRCAAAAAAAAALSVSAAAAAGLPPLLELPLLLELPAPLLVMVGSTGDEGAASEPLIAIVDAAPLHATVVATASPTNPIGTQSKAKRRISNPPGFLNMPRTRRTSTRVFRARRAPHLGDFRTCSLVCLVCPFEGPFARPDSLRPVVSLLEFSVSARNPASRARRGNVVTAHGHIETPAFMAVGTRATVTGLTPADLARDRHSGRARQHVPPDAPAGRRAVPPRRRASIGSCAGTARCSPTRAATRSSRSPADRTINEKGALFRSYTDGRTHLLSPERSIEIQTAIGSDIMMVLDVCLDSTTDVAALRDAMERTHRWALRSLARAHRRPRRRSSRSCRAESSRSCAGNRRRSWPSTPSTASRSAAWRSATRDPSARTSPTSPRSSCRPSAPAT